jgi:hypothetical protein
MTSEVVAEIELQVKKLRESGQVPTELEDELDECFEEVAEASLADNSAAPDAPRPEASRPIACFGAANLAQLRKQATLMARRCFGPSLRRLERRASLGMGRMGEAASIQLHVAADHLERLAASSPLASRVLSSARPDVSSSAGTVHPLIEGPLLTWVLDSLSAVVTQHVDEVPPVVLHAECGDGRILEALVARGFDGRGADPRWPARSGGATSIVAAGAFEYLGAAAPETLDAIVLTGVVDRLRPGSARALARLAARGLVPGGIVVLVSARPEAAVAMDPVAADLAYGRSLHPVTWCHLFARCGLSELAVFEPDVAEPDIFAVCARRPVSAVLAGDDRI